MTKQTVDAYKANKGDQFRIPTKVILGKKVLRYVKISEYNLEFCNDSEDSVGIVLQRYIVRYSLKLLFDPIGRANFWKNLIRWVKRDKIMDNVLIEWTK